jgi:GTP-binding protein Era
MKTGFCCLYGLANAGKSTLLNALLGVKVEAVSPKPQTTRVNVQGIYNDADSQIVFIDTPGLHTPHGRLGVLLNQDAENARESVDVLIYVIDGSSHKISETLIDSLKTVKVPIIACFNKIDAVRLDEGQARLEEYKKRLPQAEFIEISALLKYGMEDLVKLIKSHLKEGTPYFPPDQLIDRPTQFVWAEMIREKCMVNLEKEVPHAIHVQITHVEDDEKTKRKIIYADIIVEKDSEKSIVIGKGGQMLSKIRHHAEHSISNFMMEKVTLELYVKVVPDWRNNLSKLKEYGYKD